MNQIYDAGSFDWKLEDVTEGTSSMQGCQRVPSSGIESKITTRSFSTTGTHTLKLPCINNVQMKRTMSHLEPITIFSRLILPPWVSGNTDRGEGNVPVSDADRQQAAVKTFDVRNDTDIDIPISIQNEGTGLKWSHYHIPTSKNNIRFSITYFSQDLAKMSFSNRAVSTIATRSTGDEIQVMLNFNNLNANLDDPNNRYARSERSMLM